MSRTNAGSNRDALSISAVERETGLTKDALRVWERRYGFPAPLRDGAGERIYPSDQVTKLRLIRQLIDAGHRPRAIVAEPHEELRRLLQGSADDQATSDSPEIGELLTLLESRAAGQLQQFLRSLLHRHGLDEFARRFAPQMTVAVGSAWAEGRLGIHQEHLFTQQLTAVFRDAIDRVAPSTGAGRPKVLLTTFADEPHGLGLLMVEAILALAGASATSLGVQTPVHAISAAALDFGVDVVAISISAWSPGRSARARLADLRRLLPDPMELWAGGSCSGLRVVEGVQVMQSLDAVDDAVRRWRESHG